MPVQPKLPAIGHGIAHLHVHDACPFPVPAPPIRRMQAPEILGPPLTKMLGRRPLDFSHQPGTSYSHQAARLHKPREVVQVQIIRPEGRETIDAHDGVKELSGERQRPGVRMDRKHAVFEAGIPDSLEVLPGAEPEVRCPNLRAEFSSQEDRRRCPSAAEVQYAHAGPQVQRCGEPLAQPQRISGAAYAGENPFGMVLRRARKSLGEQ